jgi:N-acetylneuraminate synthase
MIQIIAEIGQAHEGSIGMAHAYIDTVAKTGCTAIKFQRHIAEAESSIHEPFRVQFSLQDPNKDFVQAKFIYKTYKDES